jgi:hypothetical protein
MSNQAQVPAGLIKMSAGNGFETRYLEPDSGRIYDDQFKFLFKMMRGDDRQVEMTLADYAATYDAECISANTGRPVTMRDPSFRADGNANGERVIHCRHMSDRDDRLGLFASPQGELGPADVHIQRGLPGYAAGYTLADGIADMASPPFLVPNQSDKYWTWSEKNAFTLVTPIVGGTGSPPETNAGLSSTAFQTVPYTLGAFVPTELQANADAPLNVMQKFTRIVMDKLKLAREKRVVTLLQTTGSWNSNLVNTVAAASKWNNGASADPIADLQLGVEQSYMDPTDIAMSGLLYHWFIRSPAVQKYWYAKAGTPQLPTPAEISKLLTSDFGIPPITVGRMKYLATATGGISYVWGNDAVLLRSTAALATQQDVATCRTFRWTGGATSDGSAVGGWLVRTYFDPKRGGRGGTAIVVSHYDTEVMTSNLVGALTHNAYQ